jgi:hypothetical protein
MKARCSNPNHPGYQNYGGRGITVCKRWLKFETFLADMGEKPAGLTLERIDNDKGYSKANCRWATWSEQQNNRRSQKNQVLVKGRTVKQWAREWGIEYGAAYMRLKRA